MWRLLVDSLACLLPVPLLVVWSANACGESASLSASSVEVLAGLLEDNYRALGPVRLRYSVENTPVGGGVQLGELPVREGIAFGPAPTGARWVDARFSGPLVVLEPEGGPSVWFIDEERVSEFSRRTDQLTIRHSRDNPSISLWDPRDPFPPDIRHTTKALFLAAAGDARVETDAATGNYVVRVPYQGQQHLVYGLSAEHGFLPVWSELRNPDSSVVRRVDVEYDRIESRSAWLPRTISVTFPQASEEAKKIPLPVVAETQIEMHDVELTDEQTLRPLAVNDLSPARVVDMTQPAPQVQRSEITDSARPGSAASRSWLLWANVIGALLIAVAALLRRR